MHKAATQKYVCFFLSGRELAAPIDEVKETLELRPITPVFHTPSCIAGITNLRGDVLAVLDPGVLLGLAPCARTRSARILVVEPAPKRRAGLLVDRLGALREIEHLDDPPKTLAAGIAGVLRGVVSLPERSVAVLDLEKLLSAPELAPFAAMSMREGTTADA